MVTSDVAQLSGECNLWRDSLRSFRDEFAGHKNRLQNVAGHQTQRDVLQEIEHLDNQFHIQLINIHDLKQAIKVHDRKIAIELATHNNQLSDEIIADHENLFDEFQSLEHTLRDISEQFGQFIQHIR